MEESLINKYDYPVLREQFRTAGVICLQRAIVPEWLQMAREAYDWSMAHPSSSASSFPGTAVAPGMFFQDLANPQAFLAYKQLLEDSPIADIIAALWDAPDVWFMYEQVFLKDGGESRRTPWHQDSSYLPIDGEQLAVMWISFDAVAKEDSLEFITGSHRGVLYNGSRFDPGDDTAPLYAEGSLPRLPNLEAERERWDIASWAVEPGDVVIFHPALLHGGAPTHVGGRRRTLSLRFFGYDAVYAPRPVGGLAARRAPSSSDDRSASVFTRLHKTLSAGDPFRHPEFPQIRPR